MKKYLQLFYKYKKNLLLIAFLGIISSGSAIILTYLGGLFIDVIIEATTFYDIIWICFALLATSLVSLIVDFLINYSVATVKENIVFDFKSYILNTLKKISLIDYKKYNTTYLSKRINEDSRQVTDFFVENYATFVIKIIELIIVGWLIFTISIPVGILMLILCPIYFGVYKWFKNPIFEKSLAAREKTAEFFQDYTTHLEHMEDFNIEAEFERDDNLLNKNFQSYFQKYKDYVIVNMKLNSVQGLVIALMQVIIFIIGGLSVLYGETTVGLLSILMVYFNQIIGNISYYLDLARKYQVSMTSIHRIDEIMDKEFVIEGSHKLNKVINIDVDLSYSIEQNRIFENVKFKAEQGQVIAIKGANGAGKSTLLKLMTGVLKFDKSQGSVVFNDMYDVQDLNSVHLRNQSLAYVPQTIKAKDVTFQEFLSDIKNFKEQEEIILELKDKGVPMCKVILNFITESWNKKVNDLSGGSKQIAMILRNVIKDKSILILDEPTSNLDQEKITWFKNLIKNLKKSKIIFIVSHEIDTSMFDEIVTVK